MAAFAALLMASWGLQAQSTLPTSFKEIWTGDEVDMRTGDITTDARMMSDINWDTGDLDLIDLETGSRTGLTGQGYSAGRYAWKSAFSKDGSQIAIAWYVLEEGRHELRLHQLDGSSAGVLFPASDNVYAIEPLDWSPDGKSVLVAVHHDNGVWEIGLVSVEDAVYRKLKTLGWLAPGGEQSYPRGFFSPDGQQVGFDYRASPETLSRVIHLLSLNAGRETRLLEEGTINRFLGWTADGNEILVYSDRLEGYGIWKMGKDDEGEWKDAELLADVEKGLVPFRRTVEGFAFGVTLSSTGAHVAEIDASDGRALAPPKPLHPAHNLTSEAADFSPDGNYLAYLAFEPFPEKSERLVVVNLESGAERSVPIPVDIHTTRATFRWVNERTIVLYGAKKGVRGIFRLDPETGDMTRLPEQALSALPDYKWFETSPGGRWLYTVVRSDDDRAGRQIVAVEVESGRQKVIGEADADRRTLAVSPDGLSLAYIARRPAGGFELRVSPTSGESESRIIHETVSGEVLRSPVSWAPDGKRVFFLGGEGVLKSVSVSGDPASVHSYLSGWCCIGHDLNVHPDGNRLVFLSGKNLTTVVLFSGIENAACSPVRESEENDHAVRRHHRSGTESPPFTGRGAGSGADTGKSENGCVHGP